LCRIVGWDLSKNGRFANLDVPYSAVQFVRNQLGMQVCTIASLKDLLDYLATTADTAQQVHETAIKAYRDRYGV
jgi:orotate phosphoribosyltransferase